MRVGRPAAGAQLFVNDGAGGRLSQVDVFGGLLGPLLLPRPLLWGGGGSGALEREQVRECGILLGLSLVCQVFPQPEVIGDPLRALFGALAGQVRQVGRFLGLLGGAE